MTATNLAVGEVSSETPFEDLVTVAPQFPATITPTEYPGFP